MKYSSKYLINSTINMMSPYGGTIYVYRSAGNDASFDMVIDGAIEMPYFIQGTYIQNLALIKVFLIHYFKNYILQEKQRMKNFLK